MKRRHLSILFAISLSASALSITPANAAGRTATSIPNTILNGKGAPSNSDGINGDFYIDTRSLLIFGPKANGKWPAPQNLQGPTGPSGPEGKNGMPVVVQRVHRRDRVELLRAARLDLLLFERQAPGEGVAASRHVRGVPQQLADQPLQLLVPRGVVVVLELAASLRRQRQLKRVGVQPAHRFRTPRCPTHCRRPQKADEGRWQRPTP